MEQLTDAALKVGVNLTSAQQAQFQRYFHALESANAKFNLTGVRGWERVRDELLIRSMRLLTPALGDGVPASGWLDGKSVLDVGSGAGIPGLVFKILCPSASVTLLDSSAKKTGFLREVIDDLALIDVTVLRGRAEEFGREREHRERYDLVVARSVAKLPELAELTLPFAVVGGAVISAKGPDIAGEIEQAAYAASLLGKCTGETRLPICEISDTSKERVKDAMVGAGLLN
ncbi:MAG: 16S rRNA (guanine(527)-N(7))-methyltransferase RsmG [Proteobacteria bacterium]|nr:16S rRNA (guanine(527)-N(7))-methyltransferase RsmG [Pseudomonadota bacterium]